VAVSQNKNLKPKCTAAGNTNACYLFYITIYTSTLLSAFLHQSDYSTTTTTTILRPFFRDHPGEPVPEESFWTLWCKGRLTEADTLTIRHTDHPDGRHSIRTSNQCPPQSDYSNAL